MRLVFDRGTILVLDPPLGLEPAELPGVLWDPRVRAHRAPARSYLALTAELARRGVRVSDGVRSVDRTPDRWSPVELRPYQESALGAWELAGRRGVVVLPTGSGKTRVALAAMARAGLATLCLVPTRVLLEQWLREIGRVYAGRVGHYGDGTRDLAPVTVSTFESAYRHMDRLGNRFDLVVVDEAHHFGCGIRDEALEMSVAGARLGLTATPPQDPAAVARLVELVGSVVFELHIGDLAGRFLARFDVVTLRLELTPAERTAYERDMTLFRTAYAQFRRTAPGASWGDFVGAALRTVDGARAVAAWSRARRLAAFTAAKREALRGLLARHREARLLLFTADNETAYAIAREHLVMPITCDIGRAERAEALARFRREELRALVSARVLNEGLDVPDADVAVVIGGSLGEREHVQRVGRVLRPGAGKRALVYELISRDTVEVGQARRRAERLAARGTAAG